MKIYWVENNNNDRCFIRANSKREALDFTKIIFKRKKMSLMDLKIKAFDNFKRGEPIVIISGVGSNWGFYDFF